MTNMVEKIAGAIEAKAAVTADGDLVCDLVCDWTDLARAALEAMLEPNDAMNLAGQVVGDYPWDGKKPSRVFTAMIQSALHHSPGEEGLPRPGEGPQSYINRRNTMIGNPKVTET